MIYSKNNFRQMKTQLKKVGKIASQAQKAASYRAAKSAGTEMVKAARERYVVKAGDLKSTLTIKANSDSYSLISKGGMFALAKFKLSNRDPAKRPKKGISVTVKKGKKMRLNKGAFVARMKSGHVGVFIRRGKKSTPIDERFGPGAPIMLGNEEVIDRGQERFREVYNQRVEHELDRRLK